MVYASAAVAAAIVAVAVAVGRRTRALGRTAALALAAVAAVWAGGVALMLTGWNDVDGFIDCNDYCHGWHYVGGLLFGTPVFAALALLVVIVVAAVAAGRSRAG